MPPGREFVGPGLDRIDIASGLVRHERSAPAVVAVMGHRRAAPFAVLLAAPDQRRGDHIMAVAIDVGPDLDALADDPLHGKAAAVDQRINIFDMESAAGRGALDSLSCFVHGDAIDMEMTSRFVCGKGDAPDLYRKPLAGHWFPGNGGDGQRVKHGYPLPASREFRDARQRCVQTACRMDLFAKAKELGIQTEFMDGQGHRHVTDAAALKIILDALPVRAAAPVSRTAGGGPVGPAGADRARRRLPRSRCAGKSLRALRLSREGETRDRIIVWPADLPEGSYRLHLTDAASFTEEVPLIVAPPRAFGGDFDRCWLLAVQLYGVRSARNWGIGDFTDLEGADRTCGRSGRRRRRPQSAARAVRRPPGRLQPLFAEQPAVSQCALYRRREASRISPAGSDEHRRRIARLRASDIVDYAAVAELKWRALRSAFEAFKAQPRSRTPAGFRSISRRARAAAVAVRLLRGAAAQIQQAVVGMAGGMAAAG